MIDFATRRKLLATDNDYRRKLGLAPLPPDSLTEQAVGVASLGIDPHQLRRLDDLKEERKEVNRRLKVLNVAIAAIESASVEQFVAAGTDQVRIDGRTATLSSLIWAQKIDEETTPEQIVDALRADGLEHLVKENYNSSQLSGWMRDLEEEGKPLPPHVAKVLQANEVWSVRFTSARRSRAGARLAGASSSVLEGDGASEG